MTQAAGDPGAELEAAFFAASRARSELDESRARWEVLPERIRRDLMTRPSRPAR